MNKQILTEVLYRMKDAETREKLLTCLRDQLPICFFCGSWKVMRYGNTDRYRCKECGAETVGLPSNPESSENENLIDAALYAVQELEQCGCCELEDLARYALEILEDWPTKIVLPCPKCGEDKIVYSFYPFCLTCPECQTKGPTGQTQKEAAELWNMRGNKRP